MPNRLDDLFDRLVAMQVELSATWTKPADAVPYFVYDSTQFPFWTNLLGPWNTTRTDSDGRAIYQHNIVMQLIVGSSTGGERGEYERLARAWTVDTQDYFARRPNLRTSALTTPVKWLRETAYISTATGLLVSEQSTGKEFYLNFNLVVEFGIPTPTS